MSAPELGEYTIKSPSSNIAREADTAEPAYGFEHFKPLLPNIELITVTDENLANVAFTSPLPE